MPKYKITLTIPTNPQSGNRIIIDDPAGTEKFFFEYFASGDPTPSKNPVLIGATAQQSIFNLYSSFDFNYNGLGFYTISHGADVFDIIGENFTYAPVLGNALPIGATFETELLTNPLTIVATSFSENVADTCNLIDVIVTASDFFDELLSPYSDTFTSTESYRVVGIPRDSFTIIQIKDSNGDTPKVVLNTPSYLNAGLVSLQVVNNSVVISTSTSDLDPLQYSLNDVDYQTSNVFNNLTNGDYTLYIKDPFNCKTTTTFTIEIGEDGTIVIPEPFFDYSKANAIRMAKREEWDECTLFKNSNNTLSCEVIDDVKHTEYQRFKDCDVVTLQFKSNYDDLEIHTSDDNLIQPLLQKSNNIGIKQSMDCKIADLGDNNYGVYFIAGDTYNYDTGGNLNEPYVLNGELPQFAKIGNIITISNINYTIVNVNYNEDLRVEQLIIVSTALTGVTSSIIKAIYNIYDYEIYEVAIAMTGRTELNIEVYYDGKLKLSSEQILIDDYSSNLVHLAWSMDYNTDMFYATGIVPHARLLIDTIKAGIKNEGESYETDSDSFLIDSDNYEVDIFKFLPTTKEMTRCIVLWLSSNNLDIRGIGYRKESIEIEALERSNLYVVTANLVLRGTGLYEDRIGSANVEIVELIKTNADEYIKIN